MVHHSTAALRICRTLLRSHHIHQPRYRLVVYQCVQVDSTAGTQERRPLHLDQRMARRVSFRPGKTIRRARTHANEGYYISLLSSFHSAIILYFLLMTWVIIGVLREKKPMSASSSSDSG